MKIRLLPLLVVLSIAPYVAWSQDIPDSTSTRKWYAPDAITVQYAGNIGMFAIAPSYSFARDKLNLELFYGYVPKLDADEALHIATLKGVYKPFNKARLHEDISLTPLRVGLGLSYYFRSQFSTNWSNAYPSSDYYWWTSSLRLTAGVGPEVTYTLPSNNVFKDVSFYGEVNTYDLIVTSAVKDPTLSAWDILSFSVGVRAGF
ncbi:hypothetical protein ACSX1A_02565 [Pontibacter sp. MBLB2868]|uniref:hypothetical protein n=1 Tax=Pontibacter sp. MBLB2868 TaxID=3451555 RepID=UPI003F74E46B